MPSIFERIIIAFSIPLFGLQEKNTSPSKKTAPFAPELLLEASSSSDATLQAVRILDLLFEPESIESEQSSMKKTFSSLSSSYSFMYGLPIFAVTFQSIERTLSPGRYSLTSLNSIPCPLVIDLKFPDRMFSARTAEAIFSLDDKPARFLSKKSGISHLQKKNHGTGIKSRIFPTSSSDETESAAAS